MDIAELESSLKLKPVDELQSLTDMIMARIFYASDTPSTSRTRPGMFDLPKFIFTVTSLLDCALVNMSDSEFEKIWDAGRKLQQLELAKKRIHREITREDALSFAQLVAFALWQKTEQERLAQTENFGPTVSHLY